MIIGYDQVRQMETDVEKAEELVKLFGKASASKLH